MKMSAQILKRLFEDSQLSEDAGLFVEHAVEHLWESAEASCLAVLVQEMDPPHQVHAQAARGVCRDIMLRLGDFAPRDAGVVKERWPSYLADALPSGARYSVAPLASCHEQLTLVSDGQSDPDTLALVANVLALAIEREHAVSTARHLGEVFNVGPVVLFRRRNAEGWPVDEVSPNVAREFGWSPEALVGRRFEQLVHPDDLPRVREAVQRALAQKAPCLAQNYRVLDAHGRVREIFDFTHVISDSQGRATHFHGYLFDDSERQRSEEQKAELLRQLQQSQKLQALGTLASGIAHDLNNVLAVILTSLEMASLDPALAAAPDLATATHAAMKGRSLVRQLLVFGRNAAGPRVPVRLQHVVEDSLRLVRSIVPQGVALQVELDPNAPEVLADASQLEQLLINLVTNAVLAMPHGGSLRLSLRRAADQKNHVELEVADTGTGMTPEVLARAFEPFFTTRPIGEGAGLGLAMVHAITRAHRGTVSLESTPGVGTRVLVSLPGLDQPTRELPPPPLRPFTGTGRIALVDDEPAVAHSTKRLVSRFGYEVTALSSAAAVLSLFEANPEAFDLVLTDQMMPEMTGLELGRALRERGVKVPVLLVTGLPGQVEPDAISAPFAVLGKPYRAEELGRALASLLEASKARSSA